MTTKPLGFLALFLVCGVVAFGVGYLFFYQGGYDAPPTPEIALRPPDSPAASARPAVAPLPGRATGGLLVVDALHKNAFLESEIVTLRSRVANRGYDIEFAGDFTAVTKAGDKLQLLETKLRRADSFLVILPREGYTEAEADLVAGFVGRGGKLLLVSDPTRPQQINTLAARFGLNFQPGYLYNQVEHDLNFQNILVREFQPDAITLGLDALALYTAGSIRSSGPGLAFAGGNTQSSVVAGSAGLTPMAWGSSRNVLAIADLTFMIPPQDAMLDNGRLVSNVAEYLTDSSREFDLADFPHFYDRGPAHGVDILLGQPTLLSGGADLKQGLADSGISAHIRGVEDVSRDTIFLGLYQDAPQVSPYLQAAGVRVDDTLGAPFAPDLDLAGTAITVLDANRERHVLILLADTPKGLQDAVKRLISGEFRDDLVSDFAGIKLTGAVIPTRTTVKPTRTAVKTSDPAGDE